MDDYGASIEQKSDEKAIEHIQIGNVFFILKDYFYALNAYNRAITYARTKSYLSLGYAGRSAVFFEINCYEESLKNIEWARENGFSYDKLAKLKGREKKCNQYIMEGRRNVAEDPWNFFKLSYPANEKIPWIVDCLEVRTTEKYGRGIYATKDLKAGDIISIEQPVIHILCERSYFRRCANCFTTCNLNLIPCSRSGRRSTLSAGHGNF
jgi:tetratricopeptide (TPR) repeat protein